MTQAADDDDVRTAADWKLIVRTLPRFRPDLPAWVLAMIAAPSTAALSVVQPWLLKTAIDDHIKPGHLEGVPQIALIYLGTILAAFVAESLYTVAIAFASLRMINRLRRDVYVHTLSLAASFFDVRPTGRLLTRATSDVEALGEVLTAGAVTIVLDALLVVAILAAMAFMDWRLTLVTLILGPPIAFIVDRIRRVLRSLFAESRATVSMLNAFTAERLGGLDVVQLYSDEERSLRAHDVLLDRYRVANVRTNLWDALLFAVMDGMTSIAVALMLFAGTSHWLQGVVTAGMVAAFVDYIGRLFRPIQEFSSKIAILQRAGTSLEKIFGLLDHEEKIDPGDTRMANSRGEIHVRDLRFAYGSGPDILKEVSFDVLPGQVVALVGRTGSGKSSIARILTRTYAGYRGHVALDGVELSRIHPTDVRRSIGLVSQDVQLFPGDVRFNLTLGADISDKRLLDAIHVVQADEVVAKLGGLDGRVHHQGANVSVGEAQLLSFARVMAHDPPVVLLDEATASVDTLTESRIQAATRAVFERKTVIVIAHRLSTVVDADRIVVMEGGRAVEQGTHAELMALEGAWAALYRRQFDGVADAPAPGGRDRAPVVVPSPAVGGEV